MNVKRFGYGVSAVALAASMMPVGSVFADEATTEASSYAALYAALSNKDVASIKLTGDITVAHGGDELQDVRFLVDHAVTLDLNGYKVEDNGAKECKGDKGAAVVCDFLEITKDGALTVKDSSEAGTGTLNATRNIANVSGGTLKIEGGTLASTGTYGIYALDNGDVYLNGGVVKARSLPLSGNNETGNMNFYINGGKLISNNQSTAIYMPGQTNLQITGGEIYGSVVTRMGQVKVSGGTIYATNNVDEPNATNCDSKGTYCVDYSGSSWLPAALTLWVNSGYKSESGTDLNVEITGGTFISAETKTDLGTYGNKSNFGGAIGVFDVEKAEQNLTLSVAGGTFIAGQNADGQNRQPVAIYSRAAMGTGESGEAHASILRTVTGGVYDNEPLYGVVAQDSEAVKYGSQYAVVKKSIESEDDTDTKTADEAKNEDLMSSDAKLLTDDLMRHIDDSTIEEGKVLQVVETTATESRTVKYILSSKAALDAALKSGKSIKTVLVTPTKATPTTDEATEVTKKLDDKAIIAGVYDINVLLTAGDAKFGQIVELSDELLITIDLSDADIAALKDGATREWTVIRYHDGEAEELEATYDAETNTISFKSSKFSNFTVAYQDTADTATTPDTGSFTGEGSGANVAGAVTLAVLVAVVTAFGAFKYIKR